MIEIGARTAHRRDPRELLDELRSLRDDVAAEAAETLAEWRPIVRRAFRSSAPNFAAYLALRRRDLRKLQVELMPYGLSSFGRSEARVLASLDAVIATLEAIAFGRLGEGPHARTFFRGERMLRRNTTELFGPAPAHRRTRIMVTLPTTAAAEPALVDGLVEAGMDCARINCAHDDKDAWTAMVRNIRAAEKKHARHCAICFDLPGPKARTESVVLPDPEHRLTVGEHILLAKAGDSAMSDVAVKAVCSIPSILDELEIGSAVWINDGRIGCTVDEKRPDGVVLKVTHARPKGERLKPEKGLNFPGSDLHIGSLTEQDLRALKEIAPMADMLGFSFVREPRDVADLQEALAEVVPNPERIGIMLKIETARAVLNLPDLIVASARRNPTAVMIARGDLAVEIEYQRLAEIQEEMLWLCEAAHVPVVWATEVLDSFIKDGKPSRAEFTDAAASERADCVMLNKGPFIIEAVGILSDVLRRMESHQRKNTHLLRALKSWS